jgi:hypothetical protein
MNLLVPIAVAGGVFALVKLSKATTLSPPGEQPVVGDATGTPASPTTNPQVIVDPVRAGGSGGVVPDVVEGGGVVGIPADALFPKPPKPPPRDHRVPSIPPKPAPIQCFRSPCHVNPAEAGASRLGGRYDSPDLTSKVIKTAPIVVF